MTTRKIKHVAIVAVLFMQFFGKLYATKEAMFKRVSLNDGGVIPYELYSTREASRQNKSTIGLAHQSKGINLTQSRLELDNLLWQRQAQLEIIDKKDEGVLASGTKIIIINEEPS